MTKVLQIGPASVDQIRAAAELAIDEQFAAPASAVHAAKLADALAIKGGGSAPVLEREALLRDCTPDEMATAVLVQVAQQRERDLGRVELKMRVRKAQSSADVDAVLKEVGITLQPHHLGRV